jgi:hypothetical protein
MHTSIQSNEEAYRGKKDIPEVIRSSNYGQTEEKYNTILSPLM